MTTTVQHWRWRSVRGTRFRRTLAALEGWRAEDALLELAHPGAADDQHALALAAMATVMAAPTLGNAEICVAALENPDARLRPDALTVAAAVLQTALWRGRANGTPEFTTHAARLTDRLMRVTGPLPWGRYNLALYALFTGQFAAATSHMSEGVVAPESGYPPELLGAASAALSGDLDTLARWLSEPVTSADFIDDHRYLADVRDILGWLRDDRRAQVPRFARLPGEQPGPLTAAVPQLRALKTLLADAVRGVPSHVSPSDLVGCEWAQWLCDRLEYGGDAAAGVLQTYTEPAHHGSGGRASAGQGLALSWQRLGSAQDLLPLLSEETARELRLRLASFGTRQAPSGTWGRLTGLRLRMAGAPAPGGSAPAGPASSNLASREPTPEVVQCPWWPADGVLQRVGRLDGLVERSYLEGRQALREANYAVAGQWFADARARIAGDGMATRLVALRFGSLLDYWEGVVQARLGRANAAAELLHACMNSVKAPEARAQLGLLAAAHGDHAEAARLLAAVPPPRPPAGDYLAAVLASRDGDTNEMTRLLDSFSGRELTAGVYVSAGHRLRGRVHEAAGRVAEAVWCYRRALALRPADITTVGRLARVWLWQRYSEPAVAPEPLLDSHWPTLAGSKWGALSVIHDCLEDLTDTVASELLRQVPAHPALRLLALRAAVTAGADWAVGRALQAWADADDADPRLIGAKRARLAAHLVRDFCSAGGEGMLRGPLAKLEQRLRYGSSAVNPAAGRVADPVLAFWAATARLMLNPVPTAAELPIPFTGTESRSAPVRLFTALMSVYSPDPGQRRAGARRCLALLDDRGTSDRLTGDRLARAAVRFLAADALGDDEGLVKSYGEIGGRPEAVPCDVAAGYLAVTEARLRSGDLDDVIEGFIPDPLADLTHGGVRQAMAVAYARRAVRAADHDPRAALRDARQASELLGETT